MSDYVKVHRYGKFLVNLEKILELVNSYKSFHPKHSFNIDKRGGKDNNYYTVGDTKVFKCDLDKVRNDNNVKMARHYSSVRGRDCEDGRIVKSMFGESYVRFNTFHARGSNCFCVSDNDMAQKHFHDKKNEEVEKFYEVFEK